MISWGPPGTGKTTLARLVAHGANAEFVGLSAVQAGIKDIRAVVGAGARFGAARGARFYSSTRYHRFNKAQQDAFLPYVEDGTLIFYRRDDREFRSFEVNNALLSRARVYVLKSLSTR